jgi:anti-anti-sigma factor
VWHANAFAADADERSHPLTYHVDRPDRDDVVVHLRGELSQDPASLRVERALEEHYVDDGVRHIHLDLEDLESIDLEGVAVLLHLYRESRRRGKVLTVERANGAVRRRLATTGVLRIMAPPELRAG